MNRLESLRDLPDAAWTEAPIAPPQVARRPQRGSSRVWLPLRALRAGFRDPSRVWLMTRMAVTYLEVSVFARLFALPRAFALISPPLRPGAPDEGAARAAVNALDTLLTARIPLIHPQCWRRASVLHRFLRLRGVDTTIVFGVTTDGSETLEAHAWLERAGVPYAEAAQSKSYRRVFEFPRPLG